MRPHSRLPAQSDCVDTLDILPRRVCTGLFGACMTDFGAPSEKEKVNSQCLFRSLNYTDVRQVGQ